MTGGLFNPEAFEQMPGQMAFEQDQRGIVGRRHSPQCQCGCQFVDGIAGEVVQDADTPKLEALGLVYVRFPVMGRDQVVCYGLDEVQR